MQIKTNHSSCNTTMQFFKKTVLSTVCLISVIFTCLTLIQFTKFLSGFPSPQNVNFIQRGSKDESKVSLGLTSTARAVIVDMSLLCIFMIQHSSLIPLQDFASSLLQAPALSRSLLNIFTSVTLQFLMRFWMPIQEYDLWVISSNQQYTSLTLAFHMICWSIVYVMMISTDLADLLGIKQVYNYLTGRPAPVVLKSESLKHLHTRLRHPSFLCLALIFWLYPHMRLDRLLLASVWTVYMLMVWRPDLTDYTYVVQQRAAKLAML